MLVVSQLHCKGRGVLENNKNSYAKKHVLPYFFDLCQEKEWRLGIKHTSEC